MAALLPAGIKNGVAGIPAVHEDVGIRLLRKGADDFQGHVDFCTALRAAPPQGVAQGGLPRPRHCRVDLVAVDHFPLQMGIVPSGTLRWPFRLGGRLRFGQDSVVNADKHRRPVCLRKLCDRLEALAFLRFFQPGIIPLPL